MRIVFDLAAPFGSFGLPVLLDLEDFSFCATKKDIDALLVSVAQIVQTKEEQKRAILAVHGATARHVQTVRVREVFNRLVAWEGNVEVYDIEGHPKAKRCYAWTVEDGRKQQTTAVLEIPPVDSAETAVKVAISAKARSAR